MPQSVCSTWQRASVALLASSLGASAALPAPNLPQFTGVASCQSSGCHGGGVGNDQCNTWATLDYHVRAFAILLTPRSTHIVDGMRLQSQNPNLPAAALNPSCTACHSPMSALQTSAPGRLSPSAHGDEGVSCESCHGPAGDWLRSHTRMDYSAADRIASGMTDLKSAYARANACVACHEHLSPDIARAGHPELLFELSSQTVSEPPHWRETDDWIGLHSWLAGQAVAFREDTWHLLRDSTKSGNVTKDTDAAARWEALGWMLQQTTTALDGLPAFSMAHDPMSGRDLAALQAASDQLARGAAAYPWTTDRARGLLRTLASKGAAISQLRDPGRQIHRAEVLVQAMDRLLVELHNQRADIPGAADKLNLLFADLQAPENFDATRFCRDLTAFSSSLGNS